MDRVNILGVGVSAVNMRLALSRIEHWINYRQPNYVAAAPSACILECIRNESTRKIYNRAGMVIPDGRATTWICRHLGYSEVEQVRGPDLMLELCRLSVDRGYRHFLYGGWPPDVVEKLAARLRGRFPGIQIVGSYAPPFRPLTAGEDAMVIERINAVQPDIVWIGLGTTKEHQWSASKVGILTAPVLIGVGAAFDFHAGVKPEAPRWMIRIGLEWFFRMLTEPRRLGRRYLRDHPVFIWNILLQMLGKEPPPI